MTPKPLTRTKEPSSWKQDLKHLHDVLDWTDWTFKAAVAAEMGRILEETQGGTLEITVPIPSSLQPTLVKLRAMRERAEFETTRKGILEKLPAAFSAYELALDALDWDHLPTLHELPEYEAQAWNLAARILTLYPSDQHGQAMDRFAVLCLALWWCNKALELPITHLEPLYTQNALLDAPPPVRKFEATR
jgi:hypothetical protein